MTAVRRFLADVWESLFPSLADFGVPDEYGDAAERIRDCRSDRPVLYDQEAPLASEVEAWLAGGAR